MKLRTFACGVCAVAGLLAAPTARADVTAGVVPAFEVQLGCGVWQQHNVVACYIVSSGAIAGVDATTGQPYYYAGTPDTHAGNEMWNLIGYGPYSPGNYTWDTPDPGEVRAEATGDLAQVDADVAGCAVGFELHRDGSSQDAVSPGLPGAYPREPYVSVAGGVYKLTTLTGSGGTCSMSPDTMSIGVTATVIMTGVGGGEDRDALQSALDDLAAHAGFTAPTLPERLPPS